MPTPKPSSTFLPCPTTSRITQKWAFRPALPPIERPILSMSLLSVEVYTTRHSLAEHISHVGYRNFRMRVSCQALRGPEYQGLVVGSWWKVRFSDLILKCREADLLQQRPKPSLQSRSLCIFQTILPPEVCLAVLHGTSIQCS